MARQAFAKLMDQCAPDALGHLQRADLQAATVIDPAILELVKRRIAKLLGNPAEMGDTFSTAGGPGSITEKIASLPLWPSSPLFSSADRACLALAEQFVIDVSGVSDADVQAVLAELGPAGLYGFVQALYIFDMTQRLDMCLGTIAARTTTKEHA